MAGFFCFQGSVQHLFGVDAFFHIRAAATLPEQGFVPEMPWMLESLFEGRWVDHHYGFHLLLAPFVLALGGERGRPRTRPGQPVPTQADPLS